MDIHQLSIPSIPDFDAIAMKSDEISKQRIINHFDTLFFISQILIFRFIIFVELQIPTSCDNPFLRMCQTETVELINRSIKSLHTDKITDIPDLDHSRNISSNNLRSIRQTFNSYQRMIMSSQYEYIIFDISIPNISTMIKSS